VLKAVAAFARNKLEIWGKAQRKSARRRKSDCGQTQGVKFREQQCHMT